MSIIVVLTSAFPSSWHRGSDQAVSVSEVSLIPPDDDAIVSRRSANLGPANGSNDPNDSNDSNDPNDLFRLYMDPALELLASPAA